jgi:hypothetical protein
MWAMPGPRKGNENLDFDSPTPKRNAVRLFWNVIHVAIFFISLDGE